MLLCHVIEILDPLGKKKKRKAFKSQLLVFSFETSNEREIEEELTPLFILQHTVCSIS